MQLLCLENIANIVTIIGFVIAVIGICNGIQQLKYLKQTELAKFWLQLRENFIIHNDVHLKLRNGGEWTIENKNPETVEDWAAIDAYLGQFELCELMISKELIDLDTFNSQYGYRLRNICRNDAILKKINSEKESWSVFIKLCKRLGYII